MSDDKNLENKNTEESLNEKGENVEKVNTKISEEVSSDEKVDDKINIDTKTKERQSKVKKFKIKNKKTIFITTLIGILCIGVGFVSGKEVGRKLPATSRHYNSSKVIATVGDSKITGEQLKRRMEPLFYLNAKKAMTDEEINAYESSMIDYMTTTEVLYLEAEKEKVNVTDEEVNSDYETTMSSITEKFGMTEDEFLKKFNLTKELVKADLKKELIASKYIGTSSEVSDKEAQNYYDKNKDEFLEVRASHILIKNTDDEGKAVSDEQKKKNKEQANEILKRAKNGEDFATLAKEYSQDTSASNGGDLDFFGKGQMVESFENAAFGLKNGEIASEVVESDFGYHIIKKTDEKYKSIDDVKEDLKYKLSYDKQTNIVTNLLEKYKVDVK